MIRLLCARAAVQARLFQLALLAPVPASTALLAPLIPIPVQVQRAMPAAVQVFMFLLDPLAPVPRLPALLARLTMTRALPQLA
jgi:hypothetical protein